MELRQWLSVLDVDFMSFMNELSDRLASASPTSAPIPIVGISEDALGQELSDAIASVAEGKQRPSH